jgi:NAD(P)-dependent dehydrogenase (short-subunit alcohol dehydrogenase family)
MPKVWLITGSGNGPGRDIAMAALVAGDSAVARRAGNPGGALRRAGEARQTGGTR